MSTLSIHQIGPPPESKYPGPAHGHHDPDWWGVNVIDLRKQHNYTCVSGILLARTDHVVRQQLGPLRHLCLRISFLHKSTVKKMTLLRYDFLQLVIVLRAVPEVVVNTVLLFKCLERLRQN